MKSVCRGLQWYKGNFDEPNVELQSNDSLDHPWNAVEEVEHWQSYQLGISI